MLVLSLFSILFIFLQMMISVVSSVGVRATVIVGNYRESGVAAEAH